MPSTRYQYEQKWFNDTDDAFEDSNTFLNDLGSEGFELDKVVVAGTSILYIMRKSRHLSLELSSTDYHGNIIEMQLPVPYEKEIESHVDLG